MRVFGLIGEKLGHSFSKNYFAKKFKEEEIDDAIYKNFELETIEKFPTLFDKENNLKGFNVTIPYKTAIIKFLDGLSDEANAVGAVNTIKVHDDQTLNGYNTDVIGFKNSLVPFIKGISKKTALILGTGGASKAVAFVLKSLDFDYNFVSRSSKEGYFTYSLLKRERNLLDYHLIVNTSPLGMHPELHNAPDIAYEELGSQHFLYDLIYNPEETLFMRRGRKKGCKVKNGLEMLEAQAEAAWKIWNED